MDEVELFNKKRWDDMAEACAIFTRPWLDLDPTRTRDLVDPYDVLGLFEGRHVLCLASGGGQQAVAFALLGAQVTSLDISQAQVQRDLETAAHYGLTISAARGDMRDLTRFADDSFWLVHHSYSINFVPDPLVVFREVSRVLQSEGLYQLFFANPFVLGVTEHDWDGAGYPLAQPYVQGSVVQSENPSWFFREEVPEIAVDGPIEYRHTLSTIVNGLAANGLLVFHLAEPSLGQPDANAKPGTREHFSAIAPRWLDLLAKHRPDTAATRGT